MHKSLRKLAVFSLIGFGVFSFARSMPSSFTHNGVHGVMPGAVASIHSERPASAAAASLKTRAIQDIRVGQRVLAKNPEISNLERRARREEPEFSNWLQLSLEMPKSDGSTLHIEMLRSEEWLRNQLGFVIGEVSSGERQGVSPPSVIPTATANANLAPPSPQTETLQPQSLVLLSPLRPIYCDIAFATVAAEAEGAELVGLTVDLDLPEMGACGTAVITGISTTPEIEQGDGQVVTATFRHPPSNTVLDVVFVDEGTNIDQHGLPEAEKPSPVRRGSPAPAGIADQRSPEAQTGQRSTRDLRSNSSAGLGDPRTTAGAASKPIGVTDNHLFWSEDRGEFIEIGRMDIGERVRTLFGETKILAQKLPRPGPPAEVYNLEVHEEHVYFVGDDGVLAHNTCDLAALASNRHTAWSHKISDIDDTVRRLGKRALEHSGGDWRRSEALFERYLSAVENRLRRSGSNFAVEIQPAALANGTRVPGFIQYATETGWTNRLFHFPGSRRLDAAIVDISRPAISQGGNYFQVVRGYDITLNLRKRDIVPYYEAVFGGKIWDIR